MKKIICLVISILCICPILLQGQNNNLTTVSLVGTNVDTILQRHLAGEGVEISNGKFNNQTGNVQSAQIGTFNRNGFTSFPFQRGLVLTTGNVSVAAGPNNSSSKSESDGVTLYTDTQLQPLVTRDVTSCATLEFDFVAYADTFAFNYIFGSEEYCEYVNDVYNDVFAFFLTGPDPVTLIETTKNVAIVPGSITASNPNGTPVSINNVNHGYHTSGSSGPGTSPSNSQFFIHNSSTNGVQYDGYTTALTAAATIMACTQYHMKLSVGNVQDRLYDSGVFLEEGSFYSPSVTITPTWENDLIGNDTLLQSCRELDLKFALPRPAFTNNITVIINPRGDAILGQDYSLTKPNGDPITLTQNEFAFATDVNEQNVHVKILPTAVFTPENPVKSTTLYIATQRCNGRPDTRLFDTITLYFRGNEKMQLADTSYTVCNVLEEISVRQISGTTPTHFQWSPDGGIDNPNSASSSCNITENNNYQVVATDPWGCLKDTATVEVVVVPKPDFTVTYTPDHGCLPLPVILQAQYTPDYATLYWSITSENTPPYTSNEASVHTNLSTPGNYTVSLRVESAPGCSDSISYPNAIHVSDFPHADFTYLPEEPENGQEVFFYNQTTGEDITNYTWNFGDGHASYVENPTHTYHLTESDLMTVRLTAANSDGCADDTIIVVPVEDHFALFVPSAFTPNVDGHNELFIPMVRDVTNYELSIYSRTGELIFYTNNPETGWDGNIKDSPAPQDVYVWVIHYAKIGTPNVIKMKTGSVTLIR